MHERTHTRPGRCVIILLQVVRVELRLTSSIRVCSRTAKWSSATTAAEAALRAIRKLEGPEGYPGPCTGVLRAGAARTIHVHRSPSRTAWDPYLIRISSRGSQYPTLSLPVSTFPFSLCRTPDDQHPLPPPHPLPTYGPITTSAHRTGLKNTQMKKRGRDCTRLPISHVIVHGRKKIFVDLRKHSCR